MTVALTQTLQVQQDMAGNDRQGTDAARRQQQAWQSAMEHAQLADWFKPSQDAGQNHERALPKQQAPSAAPARKPAMNARSAQTTAAHRSGTALVVLQIQPPADAPAPDAASAQALHVPLQHDVPGQPRTADSPTQMLEQGLVAQVRRIVGLADGANPVAQGAAGVFALAAQPVAAGAPAQQGIRLPVPWTNPVSRPTPEAQAQSAAMATSTATVAAPAAAMPLPPRDASTDGPAQDDSADAVRTPAAAAGLVKAGLQDAAPGMDMRVHVTWSAQGAQIWLGVDHERLASLPLLARHLEQWLDASGVKLASLVCNGRTVYTRFSPRRP